MDDQELLVTELLLVLLKLLELILLAELSELLELGLDELLDMLEAELL